MTDAVNADGTVICPLCRRLARTTPEKRLYLHFGQELAVCGTEVRRCKASQHTLDEAQTMAEHARAELTALRSRAHP